MVKTISLVITLFVFVLSLAAERCLACPFINEDSAHHSDSCCDEEKHSSKASHDCSCQVCLIADSSQKPLPSFSDNIEGTTDFALAVKGLTFFSNTVSSHRVLTYDPVPYTVKFFVIPFARGPPLQTI